MIENNAFEVTLNLNDLQKFSNGKIKGGIFCRFGQIAFPDEYWDDYLIIILSWWLERVRRLSCGISQNEEFFFMDGSFEMHVQVKENT